VLAARLCRHLLQRRSILPDGSMALHRLAELAAFSTGRLHCNVCTVSVLIRNAPKTILGLD
jgi:hypothetical protein